MLIRILVFTGIAAWVILFSAFRQGSDPGSVTESAKSCFQERTRQFHKEVHAFESMASDTAVHFKHLQIHYRELRRHYKLVEWLVNYYMPATSKLINGPLVSEAEEEEGTQFIAEPEGLQVIEEMIFDSVDVERTELIREIRRLKSSAFRLQSLALVQEMQDWQITDAIRKELLRLMALGIAGFDSPASGDAIVEAGYTLEALQEAFKWLEPSAGNRRLVRQTTTLFSKAQQLIKQQPDFEKFGRMTFIQEALDPLYAKVYEWENVCKIVPLPLPSALRRQPGGIFTPGIFNPEFFAPGYQTRVANKAAAVELGRLLFFDPVLSGDGKRSCASCHQPEKAFTDGFATSMAFGAEHFLSRNAPTLINTAYQAAYFWDARTNSLEDQVSAVAHNAHEMHGDFEAAAQLLNQSVAYKDLFHNAFGQSPLDAEQIRTAIAAYERSLTSMNSRFDRHMRGEGSLLSAAEIRGFNLFMGKALCGTCHFMPLFNGTVPPDFLKSEWEVLGVPSNPDTLAPLLDKDEGRYQVKGMELHRFAFKTPTVRNAALTAPYMHNGVYITLKQVVDFYNRGGGQGMGLELEHQTLPFDELHLSQQEQDDLVAFLQSLTDTTGLTSRPLTLPVLPGVAERKVGGLY